MKKDIIILIIILCTATLAAADVQELDDQPKGASLYQKNCASCHGTLDETRIPNRRPGRIASAIKTLGVMANLKHLNALQIVEISKVLKGNSES